MTKTDELTAMQIAVHLSVVLGCLVCWRCGDGGRGADLQRKDKEEQGQPKERTHGN